MSSMQLAASNLTTIENLNRRSAVWTLAIRVPNHVLSSRWAPTFHTITYPLPPMPPPPPPMQPHPGAGNGYQPPPQPPMPTHPEIGGGVQSPISDYTRATAGGYPPQPSQPPTGAEQHVFAILQTLPGENPFDLDNPLRNLQQVLGYSIVDWLLPLKRSPCADHSSLESEFAMGPVVSRLKREAGLEFVSAGEINDSNNNEPAPTDGQPKRKRRRGKHHHHHHHHKRPE